MKIQKSFKTITAFLIVPFFLISCGTGSNLEVLPKGKTSQNKTKTGGGTILDDSGELTQSTQTTSNTNTSSSSTNNTQNQSNGSGLVSTACTASRTKMTNLGYCKGILTEYASYSSAVSQCNSAVTYLTKTGCTEVDAALNSFATACSGVLSNNTIMSTISSENPNCYSAIQALK